MSLKYTRIDGHRVRLPFKVVSDALFVEHVIYCGVHALHIFPVPGLRKCVESIQSRAMDRHEPRTHSAYILF
jgi:hypothetical protein